MSNPTARTPEVWMGVATVTGVVALAALALGADSVGVVVTVTIAIGTGAVGWALAALQTVRPPAADD